MAGLLVRCLPPSQRLRRSPSSWRGKSHRPSSSKKSPVRRLAWTACGLALFAVLLSGCVTTASSVVGAGASLGSAYFNWLAKEKSEPIIVAPDVVDYSASVQDRAAAELDVLGEPCPTDAVLADCSALARFVGDYGRMRDQVRAAKKE